MSLAPVRQESGMSLKNVPIVGAYYDDLTVTPVDLDAVRQALKGKK